MRNVWQWWLPHVNDPLTRGRAGLVVATCAGMVAAQGFLLLAWLVSGDLQGETALIALVLSLVWAGIALLARTARVQLAAWLLVGLLFLLIAVDVAGYGLGSPAATAFFLPTLLALCTLGFGAGMGMTLASAAVVWGVATALAAGWYEALTPFEISQLTFNAPALTVMFFLGALIVGLWTQYLTRALIAAHERQTTKSS